MPKIAIVYFSGYGHTAKQAEAVAKGAGPDAQLIAIDKDGNVDEASWAKLNAAKAIIFGSPTYMGGPAWQFKKFADASSKVWMTGQWKDKIAAGFTNSASPNGDKFATLSYFITLSMQHGMAWVGTGMMPSSNKSALRTDLNWLGGFSGALAQSPADASTEEAPLPGDLETAKAFGARVLAFTAKLKD
ncbi:MAG: flavodoxin family protein [Oligoflexia bacterium]|nr:flavodoxin family protein [Oligoflexia bacterium]